MTRKACHARYFAQISPNAQACHLPAFLLWLASNLKRSLMTTFELIAYSGAAILFLACAFKIISAETLTLHLYGVEIKAEGSRPPQPQAKE